MNNLITTAQIESFIADQYNANLFANCQSVDDVKSVINDLDMTVYNVDRELLIKVAWEYVVERL